MVLGGPVRHWGELLISLLVCFKFLIRTNTSFNNQKIVAPWCFSYEQTRIKHSIPRENHTVGFDPKPTSFLRAVHVLDTEIDRFLLRY